MKKTLKFLGYGLFALIFLLALLLSAVPSVIERIASSQYAERVAEGELEIDNIDINYFTGLIRLKGVKAYKSEQQVLTLGKFEVDIALRDLLDGYLVVEDILLEDFSVEVDQGTQRIIVAGYELPLDDGEAAKKIAAETSAVEAEAEAVIKGVRLKRLSLNNIKVHFINNDGNAHATLDTLRIEDFDTQSPAQQTLVDLALTLNGVKLSPQGKNFVIPAGAKLAVQAKLSHVLDNPTLLANVSLSHLVVQAADISTELVAFDNLHLKAINYSASALSLESIQLQGLQGITADGAQNSLVKFEDLLVQGVRLPELKSLAIDNMQLTALQADVVLDKKRELAKLQGVLDYMHTAVTAEAVTSEKAAAPKVEAKPDFPVSLGSFAMHGEVYFKDNGISPAFDRTINITELEVKNFNSADTTAYTDLMLKASIGEYSKIDLQGQLQVLEKNPSGYLKGSVSGVELVPLSPYALDATGYFIRTGSATVHIDMTLQKAELGGEVDVVLSAIKLAPGNKAKMEQLKTSLSMPLDVSLGLLRDKNGDVDIQLPMEGNINSPDFSLSSVMGQVSQKVLKKASIVGLKYAFQPYGAMISVGSWLGKKATAVRLDPLLYAHGETTLNDEQKKYLAKVGEIMGNKEGLRIKLCAQASPAERKALDEAALADNPQAEPMSVNALLGMSKQRAEAVRKHLVDESNIGAQRLLLCQPSYNEKASDKQSLVHLEI